VRQHFDLVGLSWRNLSDICLEIHSQTLQLENHGSLDKALYQLIVDNRDHSTVVASPFAFFLEIHPPYMGTYTEHRDKEPERLVLEVRALAYDNPGFRGHLDGVGR